MEEVIRHATEDGGECYFWATHGGAELDLLIVKGARRHGFEFKRSSAPRLTRSMQIAAADLGLDSLTVVYPGPTSYSLARGIDVRPLNSVLGLGH
jgi:hypothetical protein